MNEQLLTRTQAAARLNIKKSTLDAWACHGRYDLPVVKVGRSCRYRPTDIEKFIDRRTVGAGETE